MSLDDRVTSVHDAQLVAVVHVGLRVVEDRGRLGQRREHVERRERPRGVLEPRRFRGDRRPNAVEDLDLALENPLVCAEHAVLVFLQGRRDEPLASGDGLFAVIVGRDRGEVRSRHLDVVAEHAVVADLERGDARSRALGLLHFGDALAASTADAAQVVQFRIHAIADCAAIAGLRRRVVRDGRGDLLADLGHVVHLADEAPDERRLHLGQRHAEAWDGDQRQPQRHQVARAGGPERRSRDEAFDVMDVFQDVPELAAIRRPKRQLLDRVEPILNPFERDERREQPAAQEPSTHRRGRAVDLIEEGSRTPAAGALDDLEMLQRRGIDDERVAARAISNRPDVREIHLLRVLQVLHQRPRGGDGPRVAVEAEPGERLGPRLIEQHPPRVLDVERPGLDLGEARGWQTRREGERRFRSAGQPGRDDDLARPKHGEVVAERMAPVGAAVLGRAEFTGRQVEQGDARHAVRAADGHDERRLAGIQVRAVGEGAGRHDADDLAADDPFRLAWIFHLLAHGDAETLSDEPRDVIVGRVVRNAAHWDGAAGSVLRPGRERQLERARGHQRVLVEHLVEIAHAKEHNRVAVLAFRVEILPHRRRRGSGRGGVGRSRHRR